jgi:RNA polymerase sigma-70 factor (ECF subfamily)
MKINTFAGTGSFEGWLRRVFMTTALEFLKYNASPEFSTDFTNGEDGELEIDDQVVEKMSAEEIMGCISELPAGCKLIFNLHAVEGYSHSEIAKMLNIKEASSRSQYAYAKRLLQIKIKKLYTHQYAETALESRYR